MAMLAEPRRKVRYMVNPTGRDWTAQQGGSNHFGQRMLRTMGWREGQGLGKDNQGAAEPIHVKRKSDQRGVGCSSTYAAETMPQSVDFASLLSQLNADHGAESVSDQLTSTGETSVQSRVSLEAKSKSSRARLHYHKFTRGKDVSAYDSHSLACIFGSRASDPQTSISQAVSQLEESATAAGTAEAEDDDPRDSNFATAGFGFQSAMRHSQSSSCLTTADAATAEALAESRHGLQLVRSQTSLQDYFRDKMRELQERRILQQQQQQEQKDEAEADKASWTSESSCSVASSVASSRKRVRFDLSDAPPPAAAADAPEDKAAEEEAEEESDDNEIVIDFRLFPGCQFHKVLGYRLY